MPLVRKRINISQDTSAYDAIYCCDYLITKIINTNAMKFDDLVKALSDHRIKFDIEEVIV